MPRAGGGPPDLDAKADGDLARVEELVAEGRMDEAEALLKRRSDSSSSPSACVDYAAFLLDQGRVGEANALQDRAVKLRLEYGDEWMLAATYRPLGLASPRPEEDDADPGALDEALEAGGRKGDPDRIADVHLGMGLAYARLGDWERAACSMRKALEIDECLATQERMAVACAVLARALEAGGDSDRAEV